MLPLGGEEAKGPDAGAEETKAAAAEQATGGKPDGGSVEANAKKKCSLKPFLKCDLPTIHCNRCLKDVPVHPAYGYFMCGVDGCDDFRLCSRCGTCGRCGRILHVFNEVSEKYTANEKERDWIVCQRCSTRVTMPALATGYNRCD